jgi:hypothetical protein
MRRLVFRMLASCRFFSVLVARSSGAHLAAPVPPASPLVAPLLMVRVLVFIVITVVEMDMWTPFAIGRRKFIRLKLAVLHRVLVVLVLEDLRGILLVQRHRSCSCYFVTLRPLRRQELLVM